MDGPLPLFDPPPAVDRADLARRLQKLAADNILIGTSSWKYQGWLGTIYSYDRYMSRGKFSKKRFEETCLAEYAETFPIVCGDFSFYQFPSEDYWRQLFGRTPQSLRFAFKAPEEITVRSWPRQPRYGDRAGLENPTFLDAAMFRSAFADLLAPYRTRVPLLIFEFGAFPKNAWESLEQFLDTLDRFLATLPAEFRYAVEIRNPEFLGPEYFRCLREHGAAHVFSSWTRMPEMGSQVELPGAFTTDFTVARALLRPGRAYEEAVARFSPYLTVQDENPGARDTLRTLIEHARERRRDAYLFVNNRLEGNAPMTIDAIAPPAD